MAPSPNIALLLTTAVMADKTSMKDIYQLGLGHIGPNVNDTILSDAVAPFFKYDPTRYIGMALLSSLLDGLFFGILLMQIAKYWKSFGWQAGHMLDFSRQRDTLWLQGVVAALGIGSVMGTVLVYVWTWKSFVIDYGTYQDFAKENLVSLFLPVGGCMAFISQIHYTHKAFVLWRRKWYIVIFPLLMAVTSLVSCIYMRVTLYKQKYILFDAPIGIVVGNNFWLGSAVLADIYLTVVISLALRASRTGWENTDKLLSKIAWSAAEVQAPPTLLALATMIEFLSRGGYMVNCDAHLKLPYIILSGKLYAMSVLFNLNSRTNIRENMSTEKSNRFLTSSNGTGQSSERDMKVYVQTSVTKFSSGSEIDSIVENKRGEIL